MTNKLVDVPTTEYLIPAQKRTRNSSYAYVDTTGRATSQTAILRSMQLHSVINHCLTFYYYMAGTGVGSLAVLQRQVGEQRRTELWSVEGDQGRGWRQARVDITSPLDGGGTPLAYRINFDAVVGSGQPGLIAIDDVVFINGPCDSDGCNVPLGMESGWITDDQITASPSGQDYPPRNARLHGNGCWIPSTPHSSWLQVEFPTTMILTGIRTQGFRTGWITKYKVEYSETLSSMWITCKAFITTDQLTGNVDADSVVEHLFSGRLQAQRIRVIPIQYHMQPSLRLEIIGCDYGSCTFDVSPCGYIRNYSIADFMWTWKTATGSEVWSPTSDHTSGAGGSFLLADATGTHVDDTAILSTEVQPPTPAKCVEFFYHMDGPDVGALNVYLKRDDMPLADAVAMTPAWRLVGQQGAGWRRGGIEITADFPYEVVFQAVIGDGGVFGYGDIGLDDVSVREGLCPYPEFDECQSSPCLNNGTCTDGKDNYTCTCGEQFYGPNCEHDMDDCKSAPCLNDGTCIDGDRNYTCVCSDAFYGSHCEFAVQCPNLTAPANGALSSEGANSYQDVVTFTCNQGYELAGASSVTCQADETWSGGVPTCIFTECASEQILSLTDSQTEGYIMSLLYPGNYPINVDCSWIITSPPTTAVQLDFVETFHIEYYDTLPDCQYDYLKVFEGYNTSAVLGTFCGDTLPSAVRTVDNVMKIHFHTDHSEQRTGFKAKYSMVKKCPTLAAPANGGLSSTGPHYDQDVVTFSCDQGYELNGASSVTCQADQTWSDDVPTCTFTTCVPETLALTESVPEGYIMSPFYPGDYPINMDCSWIITSPSSTAVQLEFVEPFHIEPDPTCGYDYVQVLEGQISLSPVLGKFCGTTLPPTLRTVGNVMTVQFHTDHSISSTGFKAKYSMVKRCPPLTAPDNGAQSPVGAIYYPDDVMTFTCNQGYELAGASNLTCQADQTWSHPVPTCTFTVCVPGETLTLTDSVPEGYIMSPFYPNLYPNGIDCSWIITSPSSTAIQLDFVETFDIEYGANCAYDYVKVFEGRISVSSILGSFCGTDLPTRVRTVGNVMTVQFRTDSSVQQTGFKVKYSITVQCPIPTAPANGALISTGPTYYRDIVTFTCDPGYELNGAAILTCQADTTWSHPVPTCTLVQCPALTAPVNGVLTPVGANSYQDVVTFTCNHGYELDGASYVTCQADQAWSGADPICQPVQCPTLTAPANGALSPTGTNSYEDVVTFTCDQGYELNGASSLTCQADQTWSDAAPTCTLTACVQGENLDLTNSVTEGYIMSPNYPGNYPSNADCSWTITAPSAIQLDFVMFDVEFQQSCRYDYVRVVDGRGSASPMLGKFCGSTLPPTVRTVGNVMSVQFRSDGSGSRAGFKAKYSIVIQCPAQTAPANGALSPEVANYYQDDVITFTCNQGYELNGASNVTCKNDTTWSHPVPTCTPTQCPTLAAPVNGALTPVGANSYQDLVTFTCDLGYELDGASSVTCHADQTWSAPVPICQPVQCPSLTAPANGLLTPVGANSYQDVVTFTCNQGYELAGASSVICQADQTWSQQIPTCTQIVITTTMTTMESVSATLSETTATTTEPTTTEPKTTLPETTEPETTLPETTVTTSTTEPTTTEPETTLPETTTITTTTEPTTTLPETTMMTTSTEPTTTMTETTLPETTSATTTTTPTTTVPETTLPDTTVPETTVPETTLSETTLPETTLPGTTLQETTIPETTLPETMIPETTLPETTVTETTLPETTLPETTPPETTLPETTEPETTLPEATFMTTTTEPTITVPETTIPETTVPKITLPDTTVPETTLPETIMPETTLPVTTVPETTVPETTVPETTLPETALPETTLPETTLPETTLPETTVAETTLPETTESETLPETTLPDTMLPETELIPTTSEATPLTSEATDTLLTTEFAVTGPETSPPITTDMIPTTESTPTVPETTTNKTWNTDSSSTMLDTTSTESASASVKPTEQLSTKPPEATKPVPTEAPTIVQKTDFVFTATTKPTEKPVNASTEKPKPKPTEPPKEDEPESSSSSQVVIIAGAAGGGAAAVAGGCACVIMIRRRKLLAGSQKREELDLMDLNNAKE
ncbi:hypothetical protein Bbelb_209560 [Branchiostoma belcheri]|nr:hypothetical protein Bbelb_209560 [Branchiostoma belcheri]